MPAYRLLWNILVAVLGGLGAVVALLSIEGGVVFSVATLSGVVTAVTHYSLNQGAVRWARSGDLPTFIAVGAAVGVALAGFIELLGAIWIPGAVLLVALSPTVLSELAPVFRCLPAMAGYLTDPMNADLTAVSNGNGPSTAHLSIDSSPLLIMAASDLTTAELCSAWRTSFLVLGGLRGGDHAGLARLVNSRQRYLDELEIRDPAGFSRWLAAGAGPGSDPSKYLSSTAVPRPRT